MRTVLRRTCRLVPLAVSLAVVATGCAGAEEPVGGAAGETPSSGRQDVAAEGFPVTVTDVCGRDVEVDAPPQRALALEQGATEVLLSLGLEDRMVGTSYLTDPVLPELADAYAQVPVLADEYPSPEVVRSAEPDFVYSRLSSAFTAEVAGTRDELADLGVPAYVPRTSCEDPGLAESFTFEAFFTEVEDVGALLGVPDRAAALVDEQRTALAEAEEAAAQVSGAPTVMWLYSFYDGAPIVAGPGGVPDEVGQLVGAPNAFDDLSTTWTEVSWEEIAQRDPDVVVLADLTRGRPGDSAADKRALVAEDPVASQLTAVTSGRVVEMPGAALDPSVRSAGVVPQLADALVEQGFGA